MRRFDAEKAIARVFEHLQVQGAETGMPHRVSACLIAIAQSDATLTSASPASVMSDRARAARLALFVTAHNATGVFSSSLMIRAATRQASTAPPR